VSSNTAVMVAHNSLANDMHQAHCQLHTSSSAIWDSSWVRVGLPERV
jgi:hypothetical protein